MASFKLNQLRQFLVEHRTVIIFLSMIFVVVIFILAFLVGKSTRQGQNQTQTPSVNALLRANSPAETESFILSYDQGNNTVRITPKITDLNRAKEELGRWFFEKGIDISMVTISWYPMPGSLPNRKPIN